jgi:hypothetical protein
MDDNRFDQGFQETPAWEKRRSLVASESSQSLRGPRPSPKPLDLRVPTHAAVVAITGKLM